MAKKSPGLISGTIRDPRGQPVAAARVSFAAGPGSLPDIAALTDVDGRFTLSAPTDGAYQVQVVADGHAPQTVTITVHSGQTVTVTVTLAEA